MKVLSAEIAASAASPADFPREGLPELALLGRSNVGKSSLLNRLVGRRKLAYISNTPGKTRLVHFYRVERDVRPRAFFLVDLPGYGFARVSKTERARWQALIESYLERRAPLRGALLLQDVRRDPSEDEHLLLEWLAERAIPAVVAITKIDKLKPGRRAARLRELEGVFTLPAGRVRATSAQTGAGLPELWRALEPLLAAPVPGPGGASPDRE